MNTLSLYRDIPMGTRIFLGVRWRMTPYQAMAAKLPARGRILDLGCGHGLLALALSEGSSEREVVGIDHDPARVRAASSAARGRKGLSIQEGSLLAPPPGMFDGIALIDVMHYFEPALQEKILSHAMSSLNPGGTLILREVDPEGGGLASHFNRFYERVATSTGFTRAEKPGLHFRKPEEWARLLETLGFETRFETCSNPLFADILYVCRKKSSS